MPATIILVIISVNKGKWPHLFTFSVHPLATLKIHFYIITMWHKLRQGWYRLKKPFLMCLEGINERFLCLTLVYVCVSHKANLELHYIWQQSPKISTFSEMIELSWQKKHPNPHPLTCLSLSFPSDQMKDAPEPPFLDLNNVPKAR